MLINMENVRRCRKCGAPLSPNTEGPPSDTRTPGFNRASRYLAIPLIAIVSVLCIYGFYRHSKGVSIPGAEVAGKNKAIAVSVPANDELEGVKKLNREFMDRIDQNAADPKGEGLTKNQTLAADTMAALKEQQNKLTDSAAQKYLDDFCSLVEKYHSQVVRLNSETARLAEVRQRITSEIEQVRQDPSLSPEDKISRQADIRSELDDESQGAGIIANDMDETLKSLRNLSVAGTAN
jgi:hypothetical protein